MKIRNNKKEITDQLTDAVEFESKYHDYNTAHRAWKRAGKGKSTGSIEVINWWRKQRGEDPVKDPKKEQKANIKDYVKNNPTATNAQIAEATGTSESSVKRNVNDLYDSGDLRPINKRKQSKTTGNFYQKRQMITDPIFKHDRNKVDTESEYLPEGGRIGEPLVKNPNFKKKRSLATNPNDPNSTGPYYQDENANIIDRTTGKKVTPITLPKEGKELARRQGEEARKRLKELKNTKKSKVFKG